MSDHLQDLPQGLAGKAVTDGYLELPVSYDDLGPVDIRLFSGLACAAALYDPQGTGSRAGTGLWVVRVRTTEAAASHFSVLLPPSIYPRRLAIL